MPQRTGGGCKIPTKGSGRTDEIWGSVDGGSSGGTRGWCVTPAGRTASRAGEIAQKGCRPGQGDRWGDWLAVAKVRLRASLLTAAAIMAAGPVKNNGMLPLLSILVFGHQ